jgi:hypothetical protein
LLSLHTPVVAGTTAREGQTGHVENVVVVDSVLAVVNATHPRGGWPSGKLP